MVSAAIVLVVWAVGQRFVGGVAQQGHVTVDHAAALEHATGRRMRSQTKAASQVLGERHSQGVPNRGGPRRAGREALLRRASVDPSGATAAVDPSGATVPMCSPPSACPATPFPQGSDVAGTSCSPPSACPITPAPGQNAALAQTPPPLALATPGATATTPLPVAATTQAAVAATTAPAPLADAAAAAAATPLVNATPAQAAPADVASLAVTDYLSVPIFLFVGAASIAFLSTQPQEKQDAAKQMVLEGFARKPWTWMARSLGLFLMIKFAVCSLPFTGFLLGGCLWSSVAGLASVMSLALACLPHWLDLLGIPSLGPPGSVSYYLSMSSQVIASAACSGIALSILFGDEGCSAMFFQLYIVLLADAGLFYMACWSGEGSLSDSERDETHRGSVAGATEEAVASSEGAAGGPTEATAGEAVEARRDGAVSGRTGSPAPSLPASEGTGGTTEEVARVKHEGGSEGPAETTATATPGATGGTTEEAVPGKRPARGRTGGTTRLQPAADKSDSD